MAEKKLKKELGLLDLICISSGVMISSGLFVLPALAYAKTGASIILSYAIGSLILIPTILSKSELVSAMPKTGGIFFFVDRSMGPAVGTLAGIIAWLSLAFKSAFSLIAIGIFVILFKPDISLTEIKTIGVACCLFFMVINLNGVKMAGKFQRIIVLFLIGLLIAYVTIGAFSVDLTRFIPFTPMGIVPVFTTAGFIVISFSGTSKIAAIAGEVKNPSKNIPLGMFYSWAIVSALYILVVFVTVGILDPDELKTSLMPISLGGDYIMGTLGLVIMSIAAILAFVSTGNAGLMSASRNPLAMGKDNLLPKTFSIISKNGAPWVSIVVTTIFMITVILFLDLDSFVKTASALELFLFILSNMAVIFMREGNISHYRPKYIAPLYPWIQIFGIICYSLLFIKMGTTPILFVSILVALSLIWYFFFTRGKIKREYAILHIVERLTGIQQTDRYLDEELRKILIERDDITHNRFIRMIRDCPLIDIEKSTSLKKVTETVAELLSEKLKISPVKLLAQLKKHEKVPETIIRSGIACVTLNIKGRNNILILLVRDREGITFQKSDAPIHTGFVIVKTKDEWHYHLHVVSWIVEIATSKNFERNWLNAKSDDELRKVLINALKNPASK
ncbi:MULTISPECIES: amino acid permease [unclassified Saccharicrinis]|uniref:amino acid permease n=1 Tax=unclassified Saccharicrinis TaxID=2646859 RepID=UPI003D33FB24